jgi:hypothetical protein
LICPKCKELGQKSTINGSGYGISTAMWCAPYYDEDGKYHHHNANSTTSQHVCSMGHILFVTAAKKCQSCDWGSEQTITAKEG